MVGHYQDREPKVYLPIMGLQAFTKAAGTFWHIAAADLQVGGRAAASTITLAMTSSPSCKRKNFMLSGELFSDRKTFDEVNDA
jgi:hypothetical protein